MLSMDLLIADDDCPKVPNPADDSLSSAQSRRYWRGQGPLKANHCGSSEARYSARHSNFWDGHLVQP